MTVLSPGAFEDLLAGVPQQDASLEAICAAAKGAGAALSVDDLNAAAASHHLDLASLSRAQWRLLLALQLGDHQVKATEAFACSMPMGMVGSRWQHWPASFACSRSLSKRPRPSASSWPRTVQSRFSSIVFWPISRNASMPIPGPIPVSIAASVPGCISPHPTPGQSSAALDHQQLQGTSPLQMQIGFFRLLQGAAYRSFRESYSANSETHLRAYDLPYTIPDFVRFVNAAIDLYLSLGGG